MLVFYAILATVVLFLLWLHWFQTRSHTAKLLNKFPGPWTPPLIGQPVLFSLNRDHLFASLFRIGGAYKETLRSWAGPYPLLFIQSAHDAEIILSSTAHIHKGIVYDVIKPWLGDGLLLSTGEKWQHRRKILTPAFHFNILRRFVTIFGEHCNRFVTTLEQECTKPKTSIIPIIDNLTLANICETAMGVQLDPEDKVHKNYLNALYKIGPCVVKRVLSPWLYNDKIYSLTPLAWVYKSYLQTVHKFTSNVIKERKINFKDDVVENLEKDDEPHKLKTRLAMLDLLISVQKGQNEIDDAGIQEEVDTFTFEGHDTTSTAARYMLMTIANHPDVQEKLVLELNEIFGTSKRQSTYDDLQQMKYAEMCIKEVLRLYPSVSLIIRQIKEDIKLTHHIAPAGTEVFVIIYHVHRDAKYFPEPEKFDPDRFLPENSSTRHPYSYIPFSAGPRNCIGQRFAMLELKCILSSVLRNFRLKPITEAKDLTFVVDFVLRCKDPIYIKFEKRN